ncbi:MAG: hypothetical protein NXI07_01055 [bacterium]|nr:hypothetical protein [bacterium]
MSSLPVAASDDRPSLALVADQTAGSAATPPLDEMHIEQLERSVRYARPARRAAAFASFSGWTTLLAGAVSLLFSIGNLPLMVFCVALAGIGTRELTLRRRLLRLETTAPRKLAINQLILGSTLAAYAVFMLTRPPGESMIASATSGDPMLQSVPEISGQLQDLSQMEQMVKAGVYVLMIVIAVLVQGGTAVYYACKSRSLRKLHKNTPEWCVRVYRAVNAS